MKVTKGTDQEICISGRITSDEAQEFKQKILELSKGQSLALNMKDVEYIPSAGLRVFVQLVQEGYAIHITDVSPGVYEILLETGMPQILKVERPLKKVSVAGLERIGEGASACVYRLDEDRIIKVFFPSIPLDFVREETERTRDAFLAGIDTMVSYDIVRTEQGFGAVYEDLHGKDLVRCMQEDHSRLAGLVEGFGRFVRAMHEKKLDRAKFGDRLDRLRKELLRPKELKISMETAQTLVDVLDKAIPKSDHFVHGDCHIGNVMYREDGSYQFIDIGRVSCGHAVYDLTSMFMQFRYQSYNNIVSRSSIQARSFSPEERMTIWRTYFRAVTGIEDEALLQKAEEQINVIGGIILLSSRSYRPDILTDKVCTPFIDRALAYAAKGCPPLVF